MVDAITGWGRTYQQNVPEERPLKGIRSPYTQTACEQCRRRKIKCNGNQPCRRCGNMKLDCRYSAKTKAPEQTVLKNSESREVAVLKLRISSLQTELHSALGQLQSSEQERGSECNDTNGTPESAWKQSSSISLRHGDCLYNGPARTGSPYDVVEKNLQSMGLMTSSTSTGNALKFHRTDDIQTTKQEQDPLRSLSIEKALYLCELFAEEANIMYPFLDMDKIKSQIEMIFSNTQSKVEYQGLSVNELDVIILMLAVSLMIESGGGSDIGRSLFIFTKDRLKDKIWTPITLTGITTLVLAGRYYFYSFDERQAWRTIGIAARQCLELGLHRTEGYSKMSPEQARSTRILFWSIFTLDRRWSFETGLPFAIQEEDIDVSVPEPDASCFYLKTMIPYWRIASNAWFSGLGTGDVSKLQGDSMEQLDYQVLDWQTRIPEMLQCPNPYSLDSGKSPIWRILQIQIYVRTNIMRVLIYRPVLYSAVKIAENKKLADLCLYLAKDTIRVLYQTNKATGIYETRQALFSFFILSSFAVILLACFNAPTEFCACVQEEVFMALELIQGLNMNSWAAKRLWKVIQDLRGVGERSGVLFSRITTEQQNKYHTTAEFYEALGRHQSPGPVFPEVGVPVTGVQISGEFTGLLEATGIYQLPLAVSAENECGSLSSHSSKRPEIDQTSRRQWVTADELCEIMRPLFQHS